MLGVGSTASPVLRPVHPLGDVIRPPLRRSSSASYSYLSVGPHIVCVSVLRVFVRLLHCGLASGAVYCNRSCLFVCLWRAGERCLLPRELAIACIDLHQTVSVCEGNYHLQLIKFWRSCAPGKGVCGGAKIFAAQCLRLSERFLILCCISK